MCRDNADVAAAQLHNPHLAMRAARENRDLRTQTAKAEGVIDGLEFGELHWRRCKAVHMYTVQQRYDYMHPRQTNALNGRAKLQVQQRSLPCIIPKNHLDTSQELLTR